uniref:hypothetical protein n=1 Tax=Castellaniella defragrans TaxID=75697 RepID=UPI003340D977
MLKAVATALLAIGIAGCAVPQKVAKYTVSAPFDEQAASEQMQPGGGVLRGNAFMRQQGGGVVTCAGSDVMLIPVTDYATERLSRVYGHAPGAGETVYSDIRNLLGERIEFSPDFPAYKEIARTIKCDGKGEFTFTAIKDGDYYVLTHVLWQVGALRQGGALAARAKVNNAASDILIMNR